MIEKETKSSHAAHRIEVFTIVLLLFWFLLRSFFLVFNAAPGAGPDELFHLTFIDLYAYSEHLFPLTQNWSTIPKPAEEFVRFGLTVERPYLFHLFLGCVARALSLDVFAFESVVFFRILNVGFVVINLLYFIKLTQLFLSGAGARILAFAIYTHMLMFTFLSATVNYDNMTNAALVASLFYFFRAHRGNPPDYLRCAFLLGIACLTKLSALPLIFILVSVMLFSIVRMRLSWSSFGEAVQPKILPGRSAALLFVAVVIVFLANAELYLGNIWTYGSITPSCSTIFSAEACSQIGHARDKEALESYLQDQPQVSIITFAGYWWFRMTQFTFGVWSGVGVEPPDAFTYLVLGFCVLVLLLGLIRRKDLHNDALLALGIYFVYAAFPMIYFNYLPERKIIPWGVNGRYLFPVHALLLVYLVSVMVQCFSRLIFKAMSLVVCLFLLTMELPLIMRSESFRRVIEPREQSYYTNDIYYPVPVYNSDFAVMSRPPNAQRDR